MNVDRLPFRVQAGEPARACVFRDVDAGCSCKIDEWNYYEGVDRDTLGDAVAAWASCEDAGLWVVRGEGNFFGRVFLEGSPASEGNERGTPAIVDQGYDEDVRASYGLGRVLFVVDVVGARGVTYAFIVAVATLSWVFTSFRAMARVRCVYGQGVLPSDECSFVVFSNVFVRRRA